MNILSSLMASTRRTSKVAGLRAYSASGAAISCCQYAERSSSHTRAAAISISPSERIARWQWAKLITQIQPARIQVLSKPAGSPDAGDSHRRGGGGPRPSWAAGLTGLLVAADEPTPARWLFAHSPTGSATKAYVPPQDRARPTKPIGIQPLLVDLDGRHLRPQCRGRPGRPRSP